MKLFQCGFYQIIIEFEESKQLYKKKKFEKNNFCLISALIFTSCQQTATTKEADPNQEFDIVILNGRVMDPETNFDGIRNVGVKDGKIAIITEASIKGKETIRENR